MSSYAECQDKLLAISINKGYLTFDDILDIASASFLSLSDIDRLSDNLQSQGVMILENAPTQLSNEPSEIVDYSRTDYDEIFSEIISLSETVTPLLDIVKDIPPPQYREIQSLTEQLKYDNDFARERLILLHIRVALKIALSISKQYSYDIEDAVSGSLIGLVEAVDHYDPDGFSAFLSYASMWIQQNIHRFCTPTWMEFYCPTHFREKLFPVLLKHNSNNGTFLHKEEYDPLVAYDIADKLDFDIEQVEKYLLFAYQQAHGRFDSDNFKYSLLEVDDKELPETDYPLDDLELYEQVAQKDLVRLLPSVLETLTPREQEIVRMRFGFYNGSPMTLEEVGQFFDITRERVRQIEKKCIRKLRHPSRAKLIKDFYC